MKKVICILLVILSIIPLTSLCINVYADAENKQVTVIGGTESKNTVGEEDGLIVSKTIEETELENYFDITLKVRTQVEIEQSLSEQDLALVIVLDVSNTMLTNAMIDEDGNALQTQQPDGKFKIDVSRYDAALVATSELITDFQEHSKDTNSKTQRQIGLVTFNSDSHTIFNLTNCKTTTKKDELINSMYTDVNNIVTRKDKYGTSYGASYTRFTNIEAGLRQAEDMLNQENVKGIKNKMIIVITDGMPTTYVQEKDTSADEYRGYNTYMSKYEAQNPNFDSTQKLTASKEGIFYNEYMDLKCSGGTNYSDRAAIRARESATRIKSEGVEIFSIGIGLNNDYIANSMNYSKSQYVDVDFGSKTKETFTPYDLEIPPTNTNEGWIDGYKKWLEESIGSGKKNNVAHYYDTQTHDELYKALNTIFDSIKTTTSTQGTEPWEVDDPMGTSGTSEIVNFVGFFDSNNTLVNTLSNGQPNQVNTAEIKDEKIDWDLKKSQYTIDDEGEIIYYIYELKYRIRLLNEESNIFKEQTSYKTNDTTILSYIFRKNGILSDIKQIEFPHPEVKGYLGDLVFTKMSAPFDRIQSKVLSGIEFTLTHDPYCHCIEEVDETNNEHMATTQSYTAVSDALGQVKFENIPSGHKYILKETNTLDDYHLSNDEYNIIVAYGNVSGGPQENIFLNKRRTGSLEISKDLEGYIENNNLFKIKLEVWFEGEALTGTYPYKINNESPGNINLADDYIEIRQKEKIEIYDLPIGATYKVSEVESEGYQVKYLLNSNETATVTPATCTAETNCKLLEGSNNVVKVINYAEYILPETGSSSKLIFGIIGILMLISPIVYRWILVSKKSIITN